MKKRNIYSNRSQELLGLFEQAGNNSKVMCVPIDYAKKDHVAMFCNGYLQLRRTGWLRTTAAVLFKKRIKVLTAMARLPDPVRPNSS